MTRKAIDAQGNKYDVIGKASNIIEARKKWSHIDILKVLDDKACFTANKEVFALKDTKEDYIVFSHQGFDNDGIEFVETKVKSKRNEKVTTRQFK